MKTSIKVLVCSASPDRVNHNALLRNFVGRGFSELLTEDRVIVCSLDYATEATKHHKPDVVVVFGSCMPASSEYTGLKQYCIRSGAVMAFWLHDDPYEFDYNFKVYQYADFIFSNDKWAVTHIDHPRVFHLPLAADPTIHFRPTRYEFERDIFFCGVGFPNRRQLIADCSGFLSSFETDIFGDEWPSDFGFCKNIRIANNDLPDYYASSLLTLNIGRRYNLANNKYQLDATTPGPRTFEAAMAGAVQCFHYEMPEIEDYFEINSEILVFDSPSELEELIIRLRHDLTWRTSISAATQARAGRDHRYLDRARKIIDIIQSE